MAAAGAAPAGAGAETAAETGADAANGEAAGATDGGIDAKPAGSAAAARAAASRAAGSSKLAWRNSSSMDAWSISESARDLLDCAFGSGGGFPEGLGAALGGCSAAIRSPSLASHAATGQQTGFSKQSGARLRRGYPGLRPSNPSGTGCTWAP